MPWIISNGKSYVEITPQNQMITTCYIDQAHAFTNKKTAPTKSDEESKIQTYLHFQSRSREYRPEVGIAQR